MPSDLERFCDAWFAAWTGGDAKRLLEFYAEDASYVDPGKPAGIRGRDALARYFDRLLGANPQMVWTRDALWPIEGGFVVQWTARIPTQAGTLVERGMDLVLLRDGKIARNDVFFDLTAWRAALAKQNATPK